MFREARILDILILFLLMEINIFYNQVKNKLRAVFICMSFSEVGVIEFTLFKFLDFNIKTLIVY